MSLGCGGKTKPPRLVSRMRPASWMQLATDRPRTALDAYLDAHDPEVTTNASHRRDGRAVTMDGQRGGYPYFLNLDMHIDFDLETALRRRELISLLAGCQGVGQSLSGGLAGCGIARHRRTLTYRRDSPHGCGRARSGASTHRSTERSYVVGERTACSPTRTGVARQNADALSVTQPAARADTYGQHPEGSEGTRGRLGQIGQFVVSEIVCRIDGCHSGPV